MIKNVNGVDFELTPAEIKKQSKQWAEIESVLASVRYKTLRRISYPSIPDQLDMIHQDKVNGTATWVDAIQTIKNTYPKP